MSMQSYSSAPSRNTSKAAGIPSSVSLSAGARLGPAKAAAPASTGPAAAGFKSSALKPGFIKI